MFYTLIAGKDPYTGMSYKTEYLYTDEMMRGELGMDPGPTCHLWHGMPANFLAQLGFSGQVSSHFSESYRHGIPVYNAARHENGSS